MCTCKYISVHVGEIYELVCAIVCVCIYVLPMLAAASGGNGWVLGRALRRRRSRAGTDGPGLGLGPELALGS